MISESGVDIQYEKDVPLFLKGMGLGSSGLDLLPAGAVVVDSGADIKRSLARYIAEKRPDVSTYSIDMTAGFSMNDTLDVNLLGDRASYMKADFSTSAFKEFHARRRLTNDKFIICKKVPPIPIGDGSVDLLLDRNGPCLYLKGEELKEYIREVMRVLKPGGEARLVGMINVLTSSSTNFNWKNINVTEVQELARGIGKSGFDFTTEPNGQDSIVIIRRQLNLIKQ